MKRKRFLALLAAAVMTFGLTGCQNNVNAEQTVQESRQTTTVSEQTSGEIESSETVTTQAEIEVSDEPKEDNSESSMIYYENETVDFSTIEIPDDILYIKFESCSLKNSSDIGKFKSLRRFSAYNCEIDDISFLSDLPNLRLIDFENTPVEKIPNLKILADPDATYVYDNSCNVYFKNCGTIDISGLSELDNFGVEVYRIDLSGSIIEDFSPLADMNIIVELKLSNTCGSNYSTLNGLNVCAMFLDENEIENIDFLIGNKIHTLLLNDNNISDWSPLLNVDGLRWCWTFNNPIIMPDNKEDFGEKEIVLADSTDYAYPYVW